MLLAIDVGNSQTVVGLFEGDTLRAHWRLTSSRVQTEDEIGVLLRVLLQDAGSREEDVEGLAVCSVVPPLTPVYRAVGERRLHRPTVVLDHANLGLPIRYHDPSSVGADRLVNALAAMQDHGRPVIVVDLGTATTFDVVDAEGAYAGGVIAPGVATSADALFRAGARLARVEVRRPVRVVGRTTEESLQAGIFYGAVGGVDAIVRRILAEAGFPADTVVVATGGLAEAVAEASETITAVDEFLTLTGIRRAWEAIRR